MLADIGQQFSVNFGMSGRYKQPVQYGRESAHKSRAARAVFSLGVCMRERQHIYEDLNESSSASPGGSQQLEIPPSPNSKRPLTFSSSADFSPGAGISTPAKILSSAYISARRQHFVNLPIFLRGTNIFQIRLFFCEAPIFFKSAYFSVRCQYFSNPPIFL
jgi:hypothetical protein